MKKITTLIFFVFLVANFVKSQGNTPPPPEIDSDYYLYKVGKRTCEILDSLNNSNIPSAEVTAKLGYAMLGELAKYKDEFEKEYDYDVSNITNMSDYSKIGQIIGTYMAGICPDLLLNYSKAMYNNEVEDQEEYTSTSENGTVLKIEENEFVCFVIKTISGKTIKVYWMTFVENDMDLEISYKDLVGKPVSITYFEQEFFDPKLSEYRYYNLLETLVLVK